MYFWPHTRRNIKNFLFLCDTQYVYQHFFFSSEAHSLRILDLIYLKKTRRTDLLFFKLWRSLFHFFVTSSFFYSSSSFHFTRRQASYFPSLTLHHSFLHTHFFFYPLSPTTAQLKDIYFVTLPVTHDYIKMGIIIMALYCTGVRFTESTPTSM